jgi:hypothetical protein
MVCGNKCFIRVVGLCIWLFSLPAFASSYFAFSGNFAHDDSQFQIGFTILSATTVTMQTWSYAGGTDPLSNVVSSGGFAPVLSLFDSTGNLLGFNAGGPDPGPTPPAGCGARNSDGGLCLDAYLQEPTLNAGDYILILTEQANTPNGPTLADGFAFDGQGDFTGPNYLGSPGSFIDIVGNPRNSSFEFTVGSVDSAAVPEPSTMLLMGTGIFLTGLRIRRARAYSQGRECDGSEVNR